MEQITFSSNWLPSFLCFRERKMLKVTWQAQTHTHTPCNYNGGRGMIDQTRKKRKKEKGS